MADTTKKPGNGREHAQAGPPTTGGSQSAKDKSRAQSRPVSHQAPAGKGGLGSGQGREHAPAGWQGRPGHRSGSEGQPDRPC